MLNKKLTLVRSLLFAGATAIIAACSSGSQPDGSMPPVAPQPSVTAPSDLAASPAADSSASSIGTMSTASSTTGSTGVVGQVDYMTYFSTSREFQVKTTNGAYYWIKASSGTQWSYNGLTLKVGDWVSANGTWSTSTILAATSVSLSSTQPGSSSTTTSTTPVSSSAVIGQVDYMTYFSTSHEFQVKTATGAYDWIQTSSATHWSYNGLTLKVGQWVSAGGAWKSSTFLAASSVSLSSTKPTSTSGTAPAPTAAPTSGTATVAPPAPGSYAYHGCVVYGPNDWFTTNLVTGGSSYARNTIDPNSANILKNLQAAYGDVTLDVNASSASVAANGTPANVATSSSNLYTVQNLHSGGFHNDAWNDDASKVIPWQSGFRNQGSCPTSGQDCHSDVITPPSGGPLGTNHCVDYETYDADGQSFNGSTFSAYTLVVHNLNYPYNAQYNEPPGATAAGLPYMGIMDYGEDASLPSIDHSVGVVLPGTDRSTVTGNCLTESCAAGGHVIPASTGPGCAQYCSYRLPFGARLRLRSTYTCPSASTNPQANKICVQLKTYGMIVMDHGAPAGHFGMILSPKSDGTNPWNGADVGAISSTSGHGIPISDFDVMTLGTIY